VDWVTGEENADVVIARGTSVVMEKVLLTVCTGFPLSLTDKVKDDVPGSFGVPVINPVAGISVRPDGRFPDEIDQV
jgi:hypothetical protein